LGHGLNGTADYAEGADLLDDFLAKFTAAKGTLSSSLQAKRAVAWHDFAARATLAQNLCGSGDPSVNPRKVWVVTGIAHPQFRALSFVDHMSFAIGGFAETIGLGLIRK
jgi:hypothetical protein